MSEDAVQRLGRADEVLAVAEPAAEASAALRLRAFMASAVDAMVTADADGRIIDWNPAAERIFGYGRDEVLGCSIELLIPARYQDAHRAGLHRLAAGGSGRVLGATRELAARRKDGREIPIELSLCAWTDGDRRFFGAVLRDITRRKRVEGELRHYADQVLRQNEALRRQHTRLVASRAALERSLREAEGLFVRLAEVLEGHVLRGRFRLERRLAAGGLGVIYEATDLESGDPLAIKVLKPPAGDDARPFFERVRREGRAALLVEHPNVVECYALELGDTSLPFLVMELLTGETLCERVRRRDVTLEEALRWGEQVAAGLEAAHQQGLVHREVGPRKVFLHRPAGGREVVKVLDFGLAGLRGAASRRSAAGAGPPVAARPYLAPERLRGDAASAASDVYGLGVLLFELVSGAEPYADRDEPQDSLFARVHQPARRLRALEPAAPAELDALLDEMLRRDPARRPSAREVAAACAALRASLPGPSLVRRAPASPQLREACGRAAAGLTEDELDPFDPLPGQRQRGG